MDFRVPEYIQARIRQRPPNGLPIVPGSTPVVAFGDVRKAKVATLGWNPSKLEFLDGKGNELTGPARRLESLSSLGEADLASASPESIWRVFEGCNTYFQRCPYRKWFDVLEKILRPLGLSYYAGTACHLDLVQWATDPTWRDLGNAHKTTLLGADLPFLYQEMFQEHIELLLLNGSGIAKAFSEGLHQALTETVVSDTLALKLFVGRAPYRVTVIGWNKNLQSSFGVSNDYIRAVSISIEKTRSEL